MYVMKIKITQIRTSKCYLFRAFSSKGVSYHHLNLAKTQMQAGDWNIAEKKEASGMP